MKRLKPRVYAVLMRLGGCASIDEVAKALGVEYAEIEPLVRRLYRDGELIRVRPNVYCTKIFLDALKKIIEAKLRELCRYAQYDKIRMLCEDP